MIRIQEERSLEELALQYQRGDQAALEILYDQGKSNMWAISHIGSGHGRLDPQDVESMILESMEIAAQKYDPARAAYMTFFGTVLKGKMTDARRRRSVRKRNIPCEENGLEYMTDPYSDEPTSPSSEVKKYLDQLDLKPRQLLLLYTMLRYSMDQTNAGEVLGMVRAKASRYINDVFKKASILATQVKINPEYSERFVGYLLIYLEGKLGRQVQELSEKVRGVQMKIRNRRVTQAEKQRKPLFL